MRQYPRAEAKYKVAVQRAPWWTAARNGLGLLYTQSGDEDAARVTLEAAKLIDPYNVRTHNYLVLLDQMKDMARLESAHFVVLYDPKADPVIGEYFSDYLEGMYKEVCANYRHEPGVKTYIEVFPTHDAFSVRTSRRAVDRHRWRQHRTRHRPGLPAARHQDPRHVQLGAGASPRVHAHGNPVSHRQSHHALDDRRAGRQRRAGSRSLRVGAHALQRGAEARTLQPRPDHLGLRPAPPADGPFAGVRTVRVDVPVHRRNLGPRGADADARPDAPRQASGAGHFAGAAQERIAILGRLLHLGPAAERRVGLRRGNHEEIHRTGQAGPIAHRAAEIHRSDRHLGAGARASADGRPAPASGWPPFTTRTACAIATRPWSTCWRCTSSR